MYYLVGLYKQDYIDDGISKFLNDIKEKDDVLMQYIIVKKNLFTVSEIISNKKIPIINDYQDLILEKIYVKKNELNEYNIVTAREINDYIDSFNCSKFLELFDRKDNYKVKNKC